MGDQDLRDLDETRRLLYIAWAASVIDEPHHTLVGTLMNALRHHSTLHVPPQVTLTQMFKLLTRTDDPQSARQWLQDVIDELTALYESAPGSTAGSET